MWELTIFWNDSTKTKEKYQDYRQVTQALDYFIKLAMPKIRHFKLRFRGDLN